MSSSGADASGLDAELALLSGPDLVARLRATCRRADYDAAARVLGDRDRRLARAEAALAKELPDLSAEVQALRERYVVLKAEQSRGPSSRSSSGAIAAAAAAPRVGRRAEELGPNGAIDLCSSSSDGDDDELGEGEFRSGVAGVSCERKESASKGEERRPARVSCKRKAPASACSPDDEDDKIPLSQLFMKKQRRAQPGANGEPKKGLQANSAGPLGVDRPVMSPMNKGITEAVSERMVGTPVDPKVAVFVQGTGNGQPGKNGGLSRTMPSPPLTGSTAGNSSRKNGSKPDGSEKPVSAILQQKSQLAPHSEQMSVESSLPSAVTRHWKSSSDVFNSCLGNKKLCMQAACALHRQKKFTTQPTAGGITKYDAHRVAVLAEFLLDGSLQGPLKRTAEDLEKHDSTGHDFIERVVLQCSEQLFSIYRNKDDKYFR